MKYYNEVIERLESFITMQSLCEEDSKPDTYNVWRSFSYKNKVNKWKIKHGESFHEGVKKNNYIKLIFVKYSDGLWSYNHYDKNPHLEILYTDKFVTLNVQIKRKHRFAYQQYKLKNKDTIRYVDNEVLTAKFLDFDQFYDFFQNHLIIDFEKD